MSLAVGARLGPYEILAPLGAGGMGQVCRARLGGDVAVYAKDDGRFKREELAPLNQRNIPASLDPEDPENTSFSTQYRPQIGVLRGP